MREIAILRRIVWLVNFLLVYDIGKVNVKLTKTFYLQGRERIYTIYIYYIKICFNFACTIKHHTIGHTAISQFHAISRNFNLNP